MFRYILPFALLLAACGGKTEETGKEKPQEKPKVIVSFENETDMDERMVEIDAIVDQAGLIASSLSYSKENGEAIQVNGHMNADNEIMKIEEFFNDGEGKNNGTRLYYLNGGRPFAIVEKFDDVSGLKPQFVDRVSYYDEKGQPLKTKERRGDYQEYVEKMTYKPVGLVNVTMDRAMRAINQEKEFQTTFQGFVYQEVFTYLIVGENNPNGFTSALRCDYKDPLIVALSGNEKGYLGEPLRVNYQKHRDETGFEFQVYAGGKFADEQ